MEQALGKFIGQAPQPKGQGANPPVTKSKLIGKGKGTGKGTTAPQVPTPAAVMGQQQGGTKESGTRCKTVHPLPTSVPASKQIPRGTIGGSNTFGAPNVVPEGKGEISSVPQTKHTDAPQVTWATVLKKGGKKTGKPKTTISNKPGPARPADGAVTVGRIGSVQGKTETNAKIRKLPKTAAVTVTCPPGQYERTILEARSKIKLSDLKIDGLRTRRAVTGALIYEIAGEDGKAKADALANKLQEALADKEGVKIARPTKMGEIRLRDLDDSASAEDILQAIMTLGNYHRTDISVGPIRKAGNGLGSVWVRCPLEAANAAIKKSALQVGWTLARVEVLETRPLQCFRCLEGGHVRATCTNSIDRSGRCYRCGEIGHPARTCTAKPKCSVCVDQGRPHDHRTGSKSCLPARRKKSLNSKATETPKAKVEQNILVNADSSKIRVVSNEKITESQIPLALRRDRRTEIQTSQKTAENEAQPMEVVPEEAPSYSNNDD